MRILEEAGEGGSEVAQAKNVIKQRGCGVHITRHTGGLGFELI